MNRIRLLWLRLRLHMAKVRMQDARETAEMCRASEAQALDIERRSARDIVELRAMLARMGGGV